MNIHGSGNNSGSGLPIPEIFDDIHDGLSAFVRLNYDKRDEHAILLLASNWDSLYDLIYAPGVFVEQWRERYSSTPDHDHYAHPSAVWGFEAPITIIIEPITIPSAATANLLIGLDSLYPFILNPGTANALCLREVAQTWQDRTPNDFGELVRKFVTTLPSIWELESHTINDANVIKPKLIKAKPFVPQYLAEFALRTRTLKIWYFPRMDDVVGQVNFFPRHSRTFSEKMTSMTIDPVKNSNLNFLHFDMDFGDPENHVPKNVADYRARFAMDFIDNPGFINGLGWPNTYYSDAPFVSTSKQNSLPKPNFPTVPKQHFAAIESKRPHHPRVIIDSVWPDPDIVLVPPQKRYDSKGRELPTTQSDPPIEPVPPICALLTATVIPIGVNAYLQGPFSVSTNKLHIVNAAGQVVPGYQVTEALLKAYTPPGAN